MITVGGAALKTSGEAASVGRFTSPFSLLGMGVVGALTLGITLYAWHSVRTSEAQHAQAHFDASAEEAAASLSERMVAYEQVLRGAVGLFHASQVVNRDEWRAYVRALTIADDYPGILGLGFAPLVAASERDAYVERMQADGAAGYRIWPQGERAEYAPVAYAERFGDFNPRALGFDLLSEPARRDAIQRARDTDAGALSAQVTLVNNDAVSRAGMLLLLPVYRHVVPTAGPMDGRAAVVGFVYAPFRIDDLMRETLGGYESNLAFDLHDGASAAGAPLLYRSRQTADDAHIGRTRQIQLYGRTWTLRIAALPEFEAAVGRWKSSAVLIAGLALSLTFMALMWAAKHTRSAAVRLARDMTGAVRASEARYRAIVEDQTDLVCRFHPGGSLNFVNEACCRHVGRRPEDLIGTPFSDLFADTDHAAVLAPIAALSAANPMVTTEQREARQDGSVRWHQWTYRALYDADGRLLEYQAVGRDITEQKRAELALFESRALLRAVIDAVPATINVKDRDGRYVLVNAATAKFLHQPASAFFGKGTADFYPATYAATVRARDARVIATARPIGPYEQDYVDAEGRTTTWISTVVPLSDDTGAVKYVVNVSLDITQRKLAEEALRESRALFRAVIDAVPAVIHVKDHNLRYVFVNAAIANYHGLPVDAFVGKGVSDFYAPSHAAEILARDAKVIAAGEALELHEEDFVEPDGRVTTWLASSTPLRDDTGTVKYVVSVALDITQRKQAERALTASERDYRRLVETQTELITRFLPDTILTFVNPAFCRYHGRTSQDLLGEHWLSQVHADDRAAVRRFLDSLTPDSSTGTIEHRIVMADGQIRWLQWSDTARFDAEGRPLEYQSVGRDVTERKLTEEKLRESERRMRHLVESAGVLPYTWDITAQRYSYVGPQIEQLFGLSAEQWTDQATWMEMVHPDDRDRVAAWMQDSDENLHGSSVEYRLLRPDGRTAWVREIVKIETEQNGRKVGYGTVVDVTDSKLRDDELQQAQKMEAVGQLTSGIAHDFNNLLMIVIGNLDLLLPRLDPADTLAQELAEAALNAGLDGAELTKQLLTFARKQPLQSVPVDLNALVTRSVGLLRRALGEVVDIEMRLAPDLWLIESDPVQLEAALTNLAINARDAMPAGGRLAVATENVHLAVGRATANGDLKPGDYVMLTVTDTGAGIPPAIIDRVFEPFFTTKETGKGSGLGLSMIYGFAKQSRGHIDIESAVDAGTSVRLYLPRTMRPAEPASAATGSTGTTGAAGEMILVVEDNALVRRSAVTLLQQLGYRTLEAADGQEALAILESDPRVDLLFSDVVMPGGMSGRQLAAATRRKRPDIRILLTSGFPDKASDARAGERTEHMLGKPYRREDLAGKLREILTG
jgi:PAS domain S-box-containing protein